jgi:hypothetical protein
MSPLIGTLQKRPGRKCRKWLLVGLGFVSRWWKCLELHSTVNVLNPADLWTLKEFTYAIWILPWWVSKIHARHLKINCLTLQNQECKAALPPAPGLQSSEPEASVGLSFLHKWSLHCHPPTISATHLFYIENSAVCCLEVFFPLSEHM